LSGRSKYVANWALIIIDIQVDFCPGGALEVRDGDSIVPAVNGLVAAFKKKALPVFYTRDWHPKDHCSFKQYGGPWPPHCVQGTPGADFHPSLLVAKGSEVISKGTSPAEDAYSGFQGTDLDERLRRDHVERIYVAGLATDYCVKNTVIDGAEKGFETYVVADCVKGVNLKPTDSATAFRAMSSHKARRTTSARVLKMLR
jgi:nicotinamidase/pyrazinamidase